VEKRCKLNSQESVFCTRNQLLRHEFDVDEEKSLSEDSQETLMNSNHLSFRYDKKEEASNNVPQNRERV